MQVDLIEESIQNSSCSEDSKKESCQSEKKEVVASEFDFIHSTFFKPEALTFIERMEDSCGNPKMAQEQIILMG